MSILLRLLCKRWYGAELNLHSDVLLSQLYSFVAVLYLGCSRRMVGLDWMLQCTSGRMDVGVSRWAGSSVAGCGSRSRLVLYLSVRKYLAYASPFFPCSPLPPPPLASLPQSTPLFALPSTMLYYCSSFAATRYSTDAPLTTSFHPQIAPVRLLLHECQSCSLFSSLENDRTVHYANLKMIGPPEQAGWATRRLIHSCARHFDI